MCAAKEGIIILLNDDTIVSESWITELIKPLFNKKIGITCGKIYRYKDGKKTRSVWYGGGSIYPFLPRVIWHSSSVDKEEPKETQFATGCAMAFRTELIKKIGLLDERYGSYYEDADFSIRAQRAGYKIIYVPKAIIWHKISSSFIKKSKEWYFLRERNRLKFIKKHFPASLPLFVIYSIIIWIAIILKNIITKKDYSYFELAVKSLKEGIS
jgi:hypothetical protein